MYQSFIYLIKSSLDLTNNVFKFKKINVNE